MNTLVPLPSHIETRPTRRGSGWSTVLLIVVLGGILFVGVSLYAALGMLGDWGHTPVRVIVDGQEVLSGIEVGSLTAAAKLAIVGTVMLVLFALAIVLPVTLALVLATVLISVLVAIVAAVGIPLLVVAVVLAVLASPLLLIVLLARWAIGKPANSVG